MHSNLTRAAIAALLATAAHAAIIDFQTPSLGALTHQQDWNATSGFTSGVGFFNNTYSDYGGGVTSWSGFALSRESDTLTAGFENQFSAFTGSGFGGSGQYAIATPDGFNPNPKITFALGEIPTSLRITNTTYAALSMKNGDGFAKKFGGPSGNDEDFLKLTIIGLDASNATTGTLDFYLADYRFTNNAQDYILDTWASVDVSGFGALTRALTFTMSSSDNSGPYMNTPAYFAVDQITTVPEPASALMIGAAICGLAMRRRRK